MAIISFASDENGNKPALTYLLDLTSRAEAGGTDAKWLLPRIRFALDSITKYGVPDAILKNLYGDADGNPFTLMEVVKPLVNHPPLLELRINMKDKKGAYRAVFFAHESNGQQYLVFTRSVLKEDTFSSEFEIAVAETEAMYPDFKADPSKYIKL